ncbi:AAA family ATPase [Bacteroidota bacterium]
METPIISLQEKEIECNSIEQTLSKISLGDVFKDRNYCYLNKYALFIAHFNQIPNLIKEWDIDCKRVGVWFADAYKHEIKHRYYNKRLFKNKRSLEYDDVYFIMSDDLLIYLETTYSKVHFLFSHTHISKVEALIKEFRKFKSRKRRTSWISLLINTSRGIDTKLLKVTRPKFSIDDNYNDEFKPIHQTIIKRLSKKNDKGLVLLHGIPGTGKTSYIRYLISSLRKQVIFLPPTMASSITDPGLISILTDNPNSIFVIEDAEKIIVNRERDGVSPVSALLNISDGLLSDCLNVQVICSFNTDISKIDSALMRKGRLIAKYEFGKLEVGKAQSLSDKLGFNSKISESTSVSDIYNQKDTDFKQHSDRSPIGFVKS